MNKNKRKIEKVLKVQQRRDNEEQKKRIVSHPFLLSKARTVKAVYQAMLVKKILTLSCLKLLKKESKLNKSNLQLISILIPPSGVKSSVCWWTNSVLAKEG